MGNFSKYSEKRLVRALRVLEDMPEPEFQEWFESLPPRVVLCVKGGLVNWKVVLPHWYIKTQEPQP